MRPIDTLQWIGFVAILAAGAQAQQKIATYSGAQAGDMFGYSVAVVGDVDHDGYDDVLVGAPTYDFLAPPFFVALEAGRVALFSGKTGATLYSSLGPAAYAEWGTCVAAAGDLNQDGYPDFLIGSPNDGLNVIAPGLVRAVSGKDFSTITTYMSPAATYDDFGYSACRAGDVNGDGYPDVLIGAPGDNSAHGKIYVYSGKTGALLYSRGGSLVTDFFGWSVAPIGGSGDLDGDGYDDFVVGAPQDTNVGPGYVRVYSGKFGTLLHTITGTVPDGGLGYSVSAIGDVDGDQVPDILVGAPYVNLGEVHVYSGSTFLLLQSHTSTPGNFGYAVRGVGDADLDGVPDYASATYSGGVPIYSGKSNTQFETVPASLNIVGRSLGVGDVNGDGLPDLAVGEPCVNDGSVLGDVEVTSLELVGLSLYGTGSPPCIGKELLTGNSVPKVGNAAFEVRGNRGPASSLGLLLACNQADVAGSDPFGIGVLLHLDLFAATEIYDFDFPTNATGHAAASTPIPNNPLLAGKTYDFQALYAWPLTQTGTCGNAPYGLSTSVGMALTIQP